jgi:hypothetical protein
VTYTTEEARQQLLRDVALASDELSLSLASLGEAYEALDEQTADRLEEDLFRPVQLAYGRLKRAHTEFAARYGLAGREFPDRSPGLHSDDPRVYIRRAIDAAERADQGIAELQDSMRPVEVGDVDLRAGLSEARSLIAGVPARGERLLGVLGR